MEPLEKRGKHDGRYDSAICSLNQRGRVIGQLMSATTVGVIHRRTLQNLFAVADGATARREKLSVLEVRLFHN